MGAIGRSTVYGTSIAVMVAMVITERVVGGIGETVG